MDQYTPKLYHAVLTKKEWISTKVIKADFRVVDPPDIIFTPGQFISIKVDRTSFRAYSICSSNEKWNEISIAADSAHNGLGANFFRELKIDDDVLFIGPSGKFCIPADLSTPVTFVVTGTGIAPIISMLYALTKLNLNTRFRLYYGVRNKSEMLFEDELNTFKEKLNDFDYFVCMSQPDPEWTGNVGYVTKHLEVDGDQNTRYLVCGNPDMVDDITRLLQSKNIPDNYIITEKFTLTQPKF